MNYARLNMILGKYDKLTRESAVEKLNRLLKGEAVLFTFLEERFLKEIGGII